MDLQEIPQPYILKSLARRRIARQVKTLIFATALFVVLSPALVFVGTVAGRAADMDWDDWVAAFFVLLLAVVVLGYLYVLVRSGVLLVRYRRHLDSPTVWYGFLPWSAFRAKQGRKAVLDSVRFHRDSSPFGERQPYGYGIDVTKLPFIDPQSGGFVFDHKKQEEPAGEGILLFFYPGDKTAAGYSRGDLTLDDLYSLLHETEYDKIDYAQRESYEKHLLQEAQRLNIEAQLAEDYPDLEPETRLEMTKVLAQAVRHRRGERERKHYGIGQTLLIVGGVLVAELVSLVALGLPIVLYFREFYYFDVILKMGMGIWYPFALSLVLLVAVIYSVVLLGRYVWRFLPLGNLLVWALSMTGTYMLIVYAAMHYNYRDNTPKVFDYLVEALDYIAFIPGLSPMNHFYLFVVLSFFFWLPRMRSMMGFQNGRKKTKKGAS